MLPKGHNLLSRVYKLLAVICFDRQTEHFTWFNIIMISCNQEEQGLEPLENSYLGLVLSGQTCQDDGNDVTL